MNELNSKKTNRNNILIVSVLFALAVFIRVYRFGAVPGGMNQDGAMAAVDAKTLAEYGTDRLGMRYPVHLTAWGFGQMSSMLSYMMVPFVRLFGLSAETARLPQLIASMAGIIFLFLFSKKAFGRIPALYVLFIAAVNPWHIMQSRWALDCNLFPHFLIAGMYLLLKGENRKPFLYISMLFFGLSMYCYGIALYTVPVFLVTACVYLICKGSIRIRDAIICAAVFLLTAWPFIACMAINFLGLDTIETPLFTIPFFPGTIRSNDILFFAEHPLSQLRANIRSTFRILFQFYGGYICNEVRGFGTMYLFSVPFTAIGAFSMFRRFRRNSGAAFTCIMFLTGILDGLITANVNINRINLIFYPLILFCGFGIYRILALASRESSKAGRICRAAVVFLFIAGFSLFSHAYFTDYSEAVSDSFMEDFGRAMVSVKDADTDIYYITPDAQYKGFWYVSEVLTLFYHDVDAKFYQSDGFGGKYIFRNPEYGIPDENAVYVITDEYIDRFDDTDFRLEQFGRFYTAVPEKGPLSE